MAGLRDSPLPEDTVFYKLFPAAEERGDVEKELDLTCLAVKCSELAKKLAEDHLWHYESFQLGVCHHVSTGMRGMCLFISPKRLVTLLGGRESCRVGTIPCMNACPVDQLNKQCVNE